MRRRPDLRQRLGEVALRRVAESLHGWTAWLPTVFHGNARAAATVRRFPGTVTPDRQAGTLRVLSLNVAHGRADRGHQLLQSPRHRERTLARIAALFDREGPDVVGLQEADGPSFWSGGFCHVDALARGGSFSFAAHGAHVEGPGLRYGTALLSRMQLEDALACTFARSLPTPAKGFTVAAVRIDEHTEIDVASVHLDFLHPRVRTRQVEQMVEVLAPRRRPLVVMGDFNDEWHDESSAVRGLAAALGLVAHSPEMPASTFPRSGARFDWILVSSQLAFERHEVLPDVVSDHLPVVADIRLADR
jgi:endonuclease/exonuclease/phosphatase family metal-dependent hydrolase